MLVMQRDYLSSRGGAVSCVHTRSVSIFPEQILNENTIDDGFNVIFRFRFATRRPRACWMLSSRHNVLGQPSSRCCAKMCSLSFRKKKSVFTSRYVSLRLTFFSAPYKQFLVRNN